MSENQHFNGRQKKEAEHFLGGGGGTIDIAKFFATKMFQNGPFKSLAILVTLFFKTPNNLKEVPVQMKKTISKLIFF